MTSQVFSDGEKGITATKMNNIVAQSVIQPDFVLSKPTSSTLDPTDNLLEVKGAGTYARITGSQLISSVSSQVDATPQIYAVRLRTFNAAGNPNFEVDQRTNGTGVTANGWIQDRWSLVKAGTMGVSSKQITTPYVVAAPGTNFQLTRSLLRTTITTAQTTLGATDNLSIWQGVEGSLFRELFNDVHSLSLLVTSSVANLKFSVALQDSTEVRSLCKLCSLGAANTPTLISLSNLPIWPAAGVYSSFPGNLAYWIVITLACGTTYTAPAADTWQTGNFFAAPGMSNLAATLNATFDLCVIQHEPGPNATQFQDLDFATNLSRCQRYFSTSYLAGVKPGSVSAVNQIGFYAWSANTQPWLGNVQFPARMAKTPTVTIYSPATGAANNVRDYTAGADRAVASVANAGDTGFNQLTLSAAAVASNNHQFHYSSDTGW